MDRKTTERFNDSVQLKTEVLLPSLIRQKIVESAARMLSRHAHRFGSMSLQVHLKRAGSQIDCVANLVTDDGRYHAQSADWDVRKAADSVMDTLDLQVHKYFQRRATVHS